MDILGIGNALVDIFAFLDDEIALALGLHPNSTNHVSPQRLDELLLALDHTVQVSGGGAANAVKTAACLGLECAFIGSTGAQEGESDGSASFFRDDLASCGVAVHVESRNAPTGRCLVLHMPGNLKTVACAPGAAPFVKSEQIPADLAGKARLIYLDGHLLRTTDVKDKLVNLCAALSIPLAIDLANPNIAKAFAPEAATIFSRCKCILFMNEDEAASFALALSQKEEALFSSLTAGSSPYPCIIKKRGGLGAIAWQAGKRHETSGKMVNAPLDDTGAGDVFAGIFLSGMLRGEDTQISLVNADEGARKCLFWPGTRLDRDDLSTAHNPVENNP